MQRTDLPTHHQEDLKASSVLGNDVDCPSDCSHALLLGRGIPDGVAERLDWKRKGGGGDKR